MPYITIPRSDYETNFVTWREGRKANKHRMTKRLAALLRDTAYDTAKALVTTKAEKPESAAFTIDTTNLVVQSEMAALEEEFASRFCLDSKVPDSTDPEVQIHSDFYAK